MKAESAKKLIMIGYFVAGFLLVAGAIYVALLLTGAYGGSDDDKQAKNEDKSLVAPGEVISTLKTASDSTQDVYNAHEDTKRTFNEEPVRLVQ